MLVPNMLLVKDGSEISQEEITAQIRVLLVAGYETTAGMSL
jgi:cytochrome P450